MKRLLVCLLLFAVCGCQKVENIFSGGEPGVNEADLPHDYDPNLPTQQQRLDSYNDSNAYESGQ